MFWKFPLPLGSAAPGNFLGRWWVSRRADLTLFPQTPPLQPTRECAVDGAIGEGLGEARIQWPPIPTLAILCAGGGVFWFLTFAAILYAL
jgi:hypothetical protein